MNNAGGVSARLFLEQSERSWRRHIDINLVSMLAATHAAAPIMKESGGGSIVNVTSIEGFRAAPMYAVYAACKAGMINFTMTMALELSEHHIRINAIAPDQTITPGLRGNRAGPVDPSTWPERGAEGPNGTLRSIPSGREGVVEDCAATAVFLCSSMGAYINGTTINVDGGTNAARGLDRHAVRGLEPPALTPHGSRHPVTPPPGPPWPRTAGRARSRPPRRGRPAPDGRPRRRAPGGRLRSGTRARACGRRRAARRRC